MTEQVSPGGTDEQRAHALSVAGLVFALAAPIIYAAARGFELVRGAASDPTLIIRALHTAYYWRAALAAWAAGLAALVVFAWFKRGPVGVERIARGLGVAALVALPCAALFVWFLP